MPHAQGASGRAQVVESDGVMIAFKQRPAAAQHQHGAAGGRGRGRVSADPEAASPAAGNPPPAPFSPADDDGEGLQGPARGGALAPVDDAAPRGGMRALQLAPSPPGKSAPAQASTRVGARPRQATTQAVELETSTSLVPNSHAKSGGAAGVSSGEAGLRVAMQLQLQVSGLQQACCCCGCNGARISVQRDVSFNAQAHTASHSYAGLCPPCRSCTSCGAELRWQSYRAPQHGGSWRCSRRCS
jgi:hypothetical protein